jgi:hypothetical protein
MATNIILRGIALLFFLAMLGFAGLQLNDPDPVLWTGYYLLCALVPLLVVFRRFYRPLFWLSVVLSLGVIAIYIPGTIEYLRHSGEEPLMQSMNPQKPYIEEARELIGGVIALVILLLARLMSRWQK